MFKLLTEEESQKVAQEYVLHRVVIMLLVLITVLIIGVIGLLPSYVLSSARQNEVTERVRIANSFDQRGDESDLRVWLTDINSKLRVLSPKFDTDQPLDFIEKILDQKIANIRITGLSWIKAGSGVTYSVSGIASDRQALVSFQDRINACSCFSVVSLLISNLAKNKDIDFQIKFSPATPPDSTKSL